MFRYTSHVVEELSEKIAHESVHSWTMYHPNMYILDSIRRRQLRLLLRMCVNHLNMKKQTNYTDNAILQFFCCFLDRSQPLS